MNYPIGLLSFWLLFWGVNASTFAQDNAMNISETPHPYLLVLGIAQDAGYPQAGCQKECCQAHWSGNRKRENVVCLALVKGEQTWLFDATPDIGNQLQLLSNYLPNKQTFVPNGIFLTHAHMGHYTGLMYLGREVIGAKDLPVYAMPKMQDYLRNNGPWSQLVDLNNIVLQELEAEKSVSLGDGLNITPFLVPHRDEFSETVGYKIQSSEKTVLFIPDIDKWNKWDKDIIAEIKKADALFIDGTFYDNGELPNRDMSEIPHPFIEESVALFDALPAVQKAKIHFIHFNHTNPVMDLESEERKTVETKGYKIANEGDIFSLTKP